MVEWMARAIIALVAFAASTPSAQPPGASSSRALDPATYRLLASAFDALRVGDYDSAIDRFTSVIAAAPDRVDVRKNLAYTYFKVGENELARQQFRAVVQRDPADEWAALELAFLEYESPETGPRATARKLFERLRTARDSTVRARAAEAFANVNAALDVREREWSAAVAKDPSNGFFAVQRARAAEESGRLDTAEVYYDRALSNSGFPGLWLDIARVRRQLGRPNAAAALDRAAADANPFVAEAARDSLRLDRSPGPRPAPATIARVQHGTTPRTALTYRIIGSTDGSWPQVLGAVGYQQTPSSDAHIVVVRPDADPGALDWSELARGGATVVLDGASQVAETFGFTSTGARVTVRREADPRAGDQPILWEHPLAVPVSRVPANAVVYSRDAASGAPLIAGRRLGRGAVLWVAANPGDRGFERFPYLIQSLADLGATPRLLGGGVQAFFDWAYRSRADPAYLARRWRAMGVTTLHVSAWYFHEPDAERDAYLTALVDAAHGNAISVYAWLEVPHVSEAFWRDHPEWREQNALLQDAAIYWRKNMNLLNDSAFAAVAAGVTALVQRFDWDGVDLSELYFEGPRGLSDPSEFTPLNGDVRREVRERYGFDPAELFRAAGGSYYSQRPDRLRQFFEYRKDLQYRLHVRMLDLLSDLRRRKGGSLGIAVCYLDDVFEPSMQDLIGADARRLLPLMEKYDFELIVQDPSVLWGLGPERYTRMAERYAQLTPHNERLSVDINVVSRPSISFPTLHQTGTELFQLVQTVKRSFPTVTIYAENSIRAPDVALFRSAAAAAQLSTSAGDTITVTSRTGVGIRWSGGAAVDGATWPFRDDHALWLPPGTHVVAPESRSARTRLLDFNGTVRTVASTPRGLSIDYSSRVRAIAVVDAPVTAVLVDGRAETVARRVDGPRTVVLLPPGTHHVELETQQR